MALILCVEDEDAIRSDIVAELNEAGYQTIEASDATKGLSAIIENRPDLVLSDITMPQMGGYELLKVLREEYPTLADTPFVFLTALSDLESRLRGQALGVDCFLTKPIDFEVMLERVASCLKHAKE